jgi:hypothetical protein
LPDSFWDEAAGPKWKELLAERDELVAVKAADEARRAGVPASADKYELRLPEDFELPEGVELNDKDARLAAFREFAHKEGLSQAQFEKVVALDAQRLIADQAMIKEAIGAERNKLGQNAIPRVDAVVTFINSAAKTPEHAKAVAGMLVSAQAVEFFEGVIETMTKQGITTFQRGTGSPPPDPNVIEGFEKMSFTQRRAAQDALAARNGKAA